jgi:hypothetical protein
LYCILVVCMYRSVERASRSLVTRAIILGFIWLSGHCRKCIDATSIFGLKEKSWCDADRTTSEI